MRHGFDWAAQLNETRGTLHHYNQPPEEHMSYGIVIFDLHGGDYAIHFVDAARWAEIQAARAAATVQAFFELAGWLTADDRPETDPPSQPAPARPGALLGTVYPQRYVIEPPPAVDGTLLGVVIL